jgi:hypothetical protein
MTSLQAQVTSALEEGMKLLEEIQSKRLSKVGALNILSERHLADMVKHTGVSPERVCIH